MIGPYVRASALAFLIHSGAFASDPREVFVVVRDSYGQVIPKYVVSLTPADANRSGVIRIDHRTKKIALSPGRYQVSASASLYEPRASTQIIGKDTEIIQLFLNPVFWGETASRAPEIVVTISPQFRQQATCVTLTGVFDGSIFMSLVTRRERPVITNVPYGSYVASLLGDSGVISTVLFNHDPANNEVAFGGSR